MFLFSYANFPGFILFWSDFVHVIVQDGFVWVMLDGGPSRAFSDTDISLMEDDLNMLKVFDLLGDNTFGFLSFQILSVPILWSLFIFKVMVNSLLKFVSPIWSYLNVKLMSPDKVCSFTRNFL